MLETRDADEEGAVTEGGPDWCRQERAAAADRAGRPALPMG